MANNYTLFSFALEITEPERTEWLRQAFAAIDTEGDGEPAPPPEGFETASLEIYGFPCTFEVEGSTAYFYSDESGDVEVLTSVLQQFLVHFNIDKGIGFEVAYTCSKPRPGEFGGGAVWITHEGVEWLSTGTWLAEKSKS